MNGEIKRRFGGINETKLPGIFLLYRQASISSLCNNFHQNCKQIPIKRTSHSLMLFKSQVGAEFAKSQNIGQTRSDPPEKVSKKLAKNARIRRDPEATGSARNRGELEHIRVKHIETGATLAKNSTFPVDQGVEQAKNEAKLTKYCILLLNKLQTERTRLAKQMLSLVSAISTYLQSEFQQLLSIYIPTVLKLTTRANKVYVSLSTLTLKTCIEQSMIPGIISILVETLKNSLSKTQRIACQDLLCFVMVTNQKSAIQPFVHLVEEGCAHGITDSSNQVRDKSRELFDHLRTMFPERVEKFIESSSAVAKKYFKMGPPTTLISIKPEISQEKIIVEKSMMEKHLAEKFQKATGSIFSLGNLDAVEMETKSGAKRIIAGPIRVALDQVQDTPKHITLAKRIPKVIKSASKRLQQPAQRIVLQDIHSSLVEENADSSLAVDVKPNIPPIVSPQTLPVKKEESQQVKRKPLKQKEVLTKPIVQTLESNFKNTNWSIRNDTINDIKAQMISKEQVDFTNANISKVFSK